MSIIPLLQALSNERKPTKASFLKILHQFPAKHGYFSKADIKAAFAAQAKNPAVKPPSAALLALLKVKPVRTLSGVTPVTVLTKPYPCPGECIFCPSDVKMPKSYLSNEPGAQRAANNHFDPYLQTYNRLRAFRLMGHVYDKVELLVLGGTWSVYPLSYRLWFIKRLFQALNDFSANLDVPTESEQISPSITPKLVRHYNQSLKKTLMVSESETATWEELIREQVKNETSQIRCVGLVLETRPDYVTPKEVITLRRLGATKIQLGLQSLQDSVLKLNQRGHTVAQAAKAMALLRGAGFKLHVHWMPNLYGSNPAADQADYDRLFSDPAFRPDEIKIYPCSLIEKTELMAKFKAGLWQPYTHEELLSVVGFGLASTPRYCRITRVVRDIPSNDIVTGNKFTNFRQMAEAYVLDRGGKLVDIRSREVKNKAFSKAALKLCETMYETTVSREHFFEYVTPDDKIAAFLRLSLQAKQLAYIREVHVYGQALNLGTKTTGAAQHVGLGKKLIAHALSFAKKAGYDRVLVISAIGTRGYYRNLGFKDGELYQHYEL